MAVESFRGGCFVWVEDSNMRSSSRRPLSSHGEPWIETLLSAVIEVHCSINPRLLALRFAIFSRASVSIGSGCTPKSQVDKESEDLSEYSARITTFCSAQRLIRHLHSTPLRNQIYALAAPVKPRSAKLPPYSSPSQCHKTSDVVAHAIVAQDGLRFRWDRQVRP